MSPLVGLVSSRPEVNNAELEWSLSAKVADLGVSGWLKLGHGVAMAVVGAALLSGWGKC